MNHPYRTQAEMPNVGKPWFSYLLKDGKFKTEVLLVIFCGSWMILAAIGAALGL